MKTVHRHLLLLLPLLLAAGSLSSCRDGGGRHDVRTALARAEALMEDSPRVARAVLDSLQIVSGKSSNRKSLALYALLRTQADYKSGEKLTSDTLIRIATDYYGTRRKSQHAALAQYYLGCTYGDMGRDLDAIEALLRATTLFPDTTNKYYAYSQRDLGELLLNCEHQQNALEALKHYRQADVCRSDSVNLGWADWYMGLAYLYLEQSGKAESFLSATLENPSVRELHDNARFQLAKLYAFLDGDYDKARTCIDGYIAGYDKKEKIGAAYFVKGEVCYHAGELDSAFYYYNKVLACEKDIRTHCETYKRLIELSQPLGRADSVTVWFQRYVALSDSVHQIRKDKEISDIESNHVVELHDQQTKARYVRLLLLGGLVMVASLSVSAIFFLMKDRRSKQMELHYEKSLNDLRRQQVNQLAQVEEKAPETEGYNEERDESPDGENERGTVTEASPFVRIQQERISLYAKRYAVSEWPSFLESRKADIRLNNKLDSERSGKLMQFLDNVFAEIFVAMLDDNKRLTKYDLQYCAMVMLGFNTKVMAYCTQASVHSYHCRHGKMKTLLSDEWYFIVFGKKKS